MAIFKEITSKDNAEIKRIVKLQSSARERRDTGLFVAEGLRVCDDCADNGIEIVTLVLSKNYYENGNLQTEENYKDGKREGLIKIYYENGNLRVEGNYKDDKLEGSIKGYYENGNLGAEGNFKDGKPEGSIKEYYENGNLKSEIFFKKGKPISGYYYDPQGNKTKIPQAYINNALRKMEANR